MRKLFLLFLALQSASAYAAWPYWMRAANGYAGPSGILSGHELPRGHAIYVCRARGLPGKLHMGTGRCYVGSYGVEYEHSQYEVLQDPDRKTTWTHRHQAQAHRLVYGGSESGNPILHICRAHGGQVVGKLVGGLNGVCFYGWYGRENSAHDFEVLVYR